ncbi:MAG: cellulose synthase subunit BcsC-related outer membrane protein, partial [Desulfobulbaceae bacterium]|nr:cellulose synthase subunit BcsC-related outer membrane protein [Desulfobulbaceae bacterium]
HNDGELSDSVNKKIKPSSGIIGRPRILDWLDKQNGSSFAVGEYFRGRSGDIGLGKLTETALSFDGIFNWDKYRYLYGYVNHLWLQSGIVPPQSYHLFGSPPSAHIHDNIGKIQVIEPGLGYYYDGPDFYLQAQLGFTPLNAVVDEQMTWRFKYKSDPEQKISGSFLVEEETVRDSFLSFVGERDLYSDLTWGGVTKQGIRAGARYEFDEKWELASELFFYPNISGIRTITNSQLGMTMLWSYNLQVEGFDYFDIGPLFIYDSYDKNTNFFTYGHCGYFSPQFFVLAGLYFDFLRTTDSKDGFFRMTGNVGYLYYEEDKVKKYPFHPENNEYFAATTDSKIGGDVRFFAGYLINDDWSLIASGGLQASMGYTSYYVGGSLVYHFGNHERMYVKDLRRSNIISRFLLE